MPHTDQIAARNLTVEKFLTVAAEWQAHQTNIEQYRALIAQAEAQQAALQEQINRCYSAATLFDFDLLAEVNAHLAQQTHGTPSVEPPPPTITPPAGGINVKDFVLEAAKAAYPRPVKAAVIRRQLLEAGRTVHEKTIGMTLYRLLKYGLIRRDGHDWFYVHEMERDEASSETKEASLFN